MKIIATIKKEFILLKRDWGGMALIFLMPMALVTVMALIQDAPFLDYQEIKIEVVLVDNDHDSLSSKLQQALVSSGNIQVIIENEKNAMQLIADGKYKAAIIIPKHATSMLIEKTSGIVEQLFNSDSTKKISGDSINIRILFDPIIKANFRQILSTSIEKILARVESELILEAIQSQTNPSDESAIGNRQSATSNSRTDLTSLVNIKQEYASQQNKIPAAMNSVQHNVPAWTMFAMFFILFPLAGNFIKEREEGSMLRLRLISGSTLPVIAGKFLFYFFVCLTQFVLMLAVGIFLLPLTGLPQLILGTNYFAIALVACAVALAATGYGMLIGVYFKTPQQALAFGSISVVILAALGGVWVPLYVMPHGLQSIGNFSPLAWGLDAFNDLFLRNSSTFSILPDIVRLTTFAAITLTAAALIHKSRTVN